MVTQQTLSTGGARLLAWRTRVGRPVMELAREMGCSRVAWYDWEKGRRVPSREMMPKLVQLTGGAVTANDFYALPALERAA